MRVPRSSGLAAGPSIVGFVPHPHKEFTTPPRPPRAPGAVGLASVSLSASASPPRERAVVRALSGVTKVAHNLRPATSAGALAAAQCIA
jgi:hypothetical protein